MKGQSKWSRGALILVLAGLAGCGADLADIPGNLLGQTNVRTLNDAQVASAGLTINEGEVAVAQGVEPRLTNPDVKAFAQQMIADHSALKARMTQLLARQNILPVDNELSQALRQLAEETSGQLGKLQAPALDNSYIASQVAMHSQALTVVDCALDPNASDPMLEDLLLQLRPEIERHLINAQQLANQLGVPDRGEGILTRCADVCARAVESETGQFFPDSLRAAICR